MRNVTGTALALAMLATLGGTAAQAASHSTTNVKNNSSSSVWITYYGVFKHQMGTQCVTAGNTATTNWSWSEIGNSYGAIYFRYEYKQNTNCGGKTTYDSHYGGAYQMPSLGKTLNVEIARR